MTQAKTLAYAPVKPYLTVSPGNQTVEATSTSTSFDVFNPNGGTMYWAAEVTSGNDWLTITVGSQGTTDGTIVTACDANPSTSPRTGSIRVSSSNADGGPIDVTVTQNGKTGGCYAGPIDAASGAGFSGDAFLMMLAAGALLVTGARASRRFGQR